MTPRPQEMRLELQALVGSTPIVCTAVWNTADPYLVKLIFEQGGRSITWEISREGLAVGMPLLEGGDIGVTHDTHLDTVTVTLRGEGGATADITLAFGALGRWLEETDRILPMGGEHLDWERLLLSAEAEQNPLLFDCIVCQPGSGSRDYLDSMNSPSCPSCGQRLLP